VTIKMDYHGWDKSAAVDGKESTNRVFSVSSGRDTKRSSGQGRQYTTITKDRARGYE